MTYLQHFCWIVFCLLHLMHAGLFLFDCGFGIFRISGFFRFFLDFFLGFFSVFVFSVFYSISQQFITQQKWSECWDCKMVACVCGSAVSVSLLFRKFSLLSLRGPSLGVRELFFSSTEIEPEDFSWGVRRRKRSEKRLSIETLKKS